MEAFLVNYSKLQIFFILDNFAIQITLSKVKCQCVLGTWLTAGIFQTNAYQWLKNFTLLKYIELIKSFWTLNFQITKALNSLSFDDVTTWANSLSSRLQPAPHFWFLLRFFTIICGLRFLHAVRKKSKFFFQHRYQIMHQRYSNHMKHF